MRKVSGSTESKRLKTAPSVSRKSTLYDELDACVTPQTMSSPNALFTCQSNDGNSDSSSSLSSLSDSDQFEDVALLATHQKPRADGDSDDDDDDVKFEEVMPHQQTVPDAPITGDLELTLTRDNRLSLTNNFVGNRGPSKRERVVREATHRIHVQMLLWHNAIRNSWLCDAQVQATMLSHLTPRMWEEVDRWRRSSGLQPSATAPTPPCRRDTRRKTSSQRPRRAAQDWGQDAAMLEEGAVNMSHGDPLFRLMQALSSWWRQRFCITAPGLRKWGYMSLERLDRLIKSHLLDGYDSARFGECIKTLEEFRQCAEKCHGSRDVGAQLFTALLRGLGLESRMVASLQCLGLGWSKSEEAEPEEPTKSQRTPSTVTTQKAASMRDGAVAPAKVPGTPQERVAMRTGQQSAFGEGDLKLEYADTDDESVVEMQMTPQRPHKRKPIDADLVYPLYWTEILSPVTRKYLPVDAIVRNTVATNRDLVEQFEPRCARSRQILAYVVGFSPDGTAKDVTVRYLKRAVFPGKTKGFRYPVKRTPIYNRYGKVERYEDVDWFGATMSGYCRGGNKAPITVADELEDCSDLTPAIVGARQVKEGQETLQYYKQSQEFVLQKHLKREEALKPDAKPVKKFKSKGKGGLVCEEDVFLRSDVILVKSVETWHKQGLAPNAGEQPLKQVPYRAATTKRRREILDVESSTGKKMLQGLYSFEQTAWIIPPPIQNGIIPKNEYGSACQHYFFRSNLANHRRVAILTFSSRTCAPKEQFTYRLEVP